MQRDIREILLTEEQIQAKVKEFAQLINEKYAGKDPVFIGVLKGVIIFFSDVVRLVNIPSQIDFIWLSSYGSGTSAGKMVVKQDVSVDLKGRHVVILEDIFDTGSSLQYTYDHIMSKEPASLEIFTLLDKPERRKEGITVKADHTGFVIPNEFVVGYGLDYNEHYRNLPFVGILDPDVYK